MAAEGRHGGADGCDCRLGRRGPWWRCSRRFHGSASGKDFWCVGRLHGGFVGGTEEVLGGGFMVEV